MREALKDWFATVLLNTPFVGDWIAQANTEWMLLGMALMVIVLVLSGFAIAFLLPSRWSFTTRLRLAVTISLLLALGSLFPWISVVEAKNAVRIECRVEPGTMAFAQYGVLVSELRFCRTKPTDFAPYGEWYLAQVEGQNVRVSDRQWREYFDAQRSAGKTQPE